MDTPEQAIERFAQAMRFNPLDPLLFLMRPALR
jgi:hypothetical protein